MSSIDNNKKLAIDIALLLPPEIVEVCVALNKESDKTKYISFLDGYQPHISLAMGCVLESDFSKLKQELEGKTKGVQALTLSILEFETWPVDQKVIFGLSVLLTNEIKILHALCMEVMKRYASYESSPEMFDEPERINERSINWVNNYKKHFNPDIYKPHITLGADFAKSVPIISKQFISSKLAVFQLGPYDTCRKMLTSFDLK